MYISPPIIARQYFSQESVVRGISIKACTLIDRNSLIDAPNDDGAFDEIKHLLELIYWIKVTAAKA